MKDLTLSVDDQKLNVRAAAVIIHNNKVLVHRNTKNNDMHCALIGGRVAIGEDSAKTILREVFEEIGKEIYITGYIATLENFFVSKGEKYHEFMFVHRAEFLRDEDKKLTENLRNVEGKDYLVYEWIDLAKIDEYNLKPVILKRILKASSFPVHEINYDDNYDLISKE